MGDNFTGPQSKRNQRAPAAIVSETVKIPKARSSYNRTAFSQYLRALGQDFAYLRGLSLKEVRERGFAQGVATKFVLWMREGRPDKVTPRAAELPITRRKKIDVWIISETRDILKARGGFNEKEFLWFLHNTVFVVRALIVPLRDDIFPHWVRGSAESLADEFARWQAGSLQ
jgi:hypothetical protein